jgi:hypothetical protein
MIQSHKKIEGNGMRTLNNFTVVGNQSRIVPFMEYTATGLHFTKATIDLMGAPEFVHFLVSSDEKKVAVQACQNDDAGALKFHSVLKPGTVRRGRKPKNPVAEKVKAIKINDPAIVKIFRDKFRITENTNSFLIKGTMLPDEKAVIFHLDKAEKRKINKRGRKKRSI